MKNVIVLFIFACSMHYYVFSQTGLRFPDSNAVWSQQECKFSVKGDTLLDGKHYQKFYSQCDTNNFSFDFNLASYYAAVRQDSNRVFVWHPLDTCERLVYDFNIVEGDSIEVWTMPYSYISGVSTPVCKRLLHVYSSQNHSFEDGVPRKLVQFNDFHLGMQLTWIEGIGCNYGLFHPFYYVPGLCSFGFNEDIQNNAWLLCLQQDASILHITNMSPIDPSNCFYFFHYGISTIEKNQTELYPNPAKDNCTLLYYLDTEQKGSIEIFNLLGEKVFSCDLITEETSFDFSTASFNEGVYLCRILVNNEVVSSNKLVILK